MYSISEQRWLLSLARQSISHYLKTGKKIEEKSESFPESFLEKRGVFVALTIEKELRGCIGNIEPVMPLYKGVMENALKSAFGDPRFLPLSIEEFNLTELEISVLSKPIPLKYNGADDLLNKLKPEIDGVIIRKGFYASTFLPQVWEQIRKPNEFLSHLCAKAGLNPYEWKKGDLNVETYQAEAFFEKDILVLAG